MYLFFDTETTGLPRSWQAPVTDLDNWPRVVQIAWARYDARERHLETKSYIVKPDGFNIPRNAERVHGISTARAIADGRPLKTVLKAFVEAIANANVVVAHNMSFEEKVIGAEFLRSGMGAPLGVKHRICTMTGATEYCRLSGPYGYKWPTLSELHVALFGSDLDETHNAEADVAACVRCFFELKRRRIIMARGKRT